jgi:hypothetical protein
LGSWTSAGNQPQDIATNGTDIWIVDDARGQVFYYAGGAAWRNNNGNRNPTSVFNLRTVNGQNGPEESNKNPTGMVFRDGKLWITDRKDADTSRVFVYTSTGSYLGKWNLDPLNNDPTGITLNPNGGSDMWVVDRLDSKVYTYVGATLWTSGNRIATGFFPLHPSNHHAEGIADPPVITASEPSSNSQLTNGNSYLVTGQVSPNTAEVNTVRIDGVPAASVDVAGNFFQPIQVTSATNSINLSAIDLQGDSATLSIPVTVTSSSLQNNIDFSLTTPAASTGLLAEYARTSYNDKSNTLLKLLRRPADQPPKIACGNTMSRLPIRTATPSLIRSMLSPMERRSTPPLATFGRWFVPFCS